MKNQKIVFLTVCVHPIGGHAQTVATVRGTKNGKLAELQFVGDQAKHKFKTVAEAYWHLVRTYYAENVASYFDVPDDAPDFWLLPE